jgi:hypothetical protein
MKYFMSVLLMASAMSYGVEKNNALPKDMDLNNEDLTISSEAEVALRANDIDSDSDSGDMHGVIADNGRASPDGLVIDILSNDTDPNNEDLQIRDEPMPRELDVNPGVFSYYMPGMDGYRPIIADNNTGDLLLPENDIRFRPNPNTFDNDLPDLPDQSTENRSNCFSTNNRRPPA